MPAQTNQRIDGKRLWDSLMSMATIGATPAVQNAVVDAVSHLGVRHIDMPCTPMRVWRAIRAANEEEQR